MRKYFQNRCDIFSYSTLYLFFISSILSKINFDSLVNYLNFALIRINRNRKFDKTI